MLDHQLLHHREGVIMGKQMADVMIHIDETFAA
jgi:hypothetical protein